jgi:hypothetical protein
VACLFKRERERERGEEREKEIRKYERAKSQGSARLGTPLPAAARRLGRNPLTPAPRVAQGHFD